MMNDDDDDDDDEWQWMTMNDNDEPTISFLFSSYFLSSQGSSAQGLSKLSGLYSVSLS